MRLEAASASSTLTIVYSSSPSEKSTHTREPTLTVSLSHTIDVISPSSCTKERWHAGRHRCRNALDRFCHVSHLQVSRPRRAEYVGNRKATTTGKGQRGAVLGTNDSIVCRPTCR